MSFHPFEINAPHVVYAILGGFVVLFGMFSLVIREKLYIGEAPIAFIFGIIVGPYGGNIFNPRSWGGGSEETLNSITLEFTRVVLAIGVFAIGVELPKAYMAKHWKSLFFLLIPIMSWGWIVCAGLIYALIPNLNFVPSLAVAACLTPTDPILAAAVVGGKFADKHVPAHLRNLLTAESGCNDGAAFPFLYIALYLVTESSSSHAVQDWFLITWFYEILLGTVFGAIIGVAFRHLMKFCERRDLIDRQSYVAQYVSLATFVIGVTTMLGSDDLLAAFACGTAFAWDGFFNKQTEQSVFSSVIDLLFNIAAFVYIGAWMPFDSFSNEGLSLSVWRLIVIAILVLLLRRLPIVIALYKWIPDIKTFREAVFSGHFGPIGVGAVFISTLAVGALPKPDNPSKDNQPELLAATIQPVVAFMVLCSIALHGLSIPFFSLGRRVHSVSRTWSRHQSMDVHGPEWATQTRRVSRPEEIVVNRDNVMERGEVGVSPVDEKKPMESEPASSLTPSSSEPSKEKVEDQPEGGAGVTAGDLTARTEGRPDDMPDNTVEEWREGRDIIIERQRGPGEEVEVQVKRGAAAEEDGEEVLHTIHGTASEIEFQLKHLKDRLREKAGHEKKHAEHGLEDIEEGTRELKDEAGKKVKIVEDALRPGRMSRHESEHSHTGILLQRRESQRSGGGDDEDNEEAWASDNDEQGLGPSRFSKEGDDGDGGRKRSKSPKQKALGARRHRTSIRRSLLGKVRSHKHFGSGKSRRSDDEDEETEGEERGRQVSSPLPESPTVARAFDMGHRRFESLGTPRSASPARSFRSVRFAAEGGETPSGSSTPRHIAFDLPDDTRS